MKVIGKLISGINGLASGIAGVLVIIMVVHVSADVTMRYVFERPLDATILYVSVFYMIAIAFLPLGLVEQKDSHIAVELLAERFPDRIQTALAFIATLVTAIVAAAVTVRTGQEALSKYAAGAYSIEAGGKILTWPSYFYLPIGFGMMAVVSVWKLIAMLTGRDSGLSMMKVEDPYLSEEKSNV
ncbi:C4-dicarboxylate ABC transporter permease [Sulfitobacter alexandrii]|uniref:TRAP transporter small permease protein n=1 Tax=Sulfitobacter alexandrii TaxID=1917485 RepID=A0A1J0WDT5_9RHOB|nr:TRAP transporter small permease [Sulfitobacter alexandrii]APE42479.1 C4-dicarboxylate ABC transporter permease [Sulfitobacter alexandrii]